MTDQTNGLFEQSLALARQGRFAPALQALERLLAQAPDRADALALQAALLTETGAPDRAIPVFERALAENPAIRAMIPDANAALDATKPEAAVEVRLPDDLVASNIDKVGWALIAEHPMALELAGIILLMAMLGAVVLARKQIEIGEAEKSEAAERLRQPGGAA